MCSPSLGPAFFHFRSGGPAPARWGFWAVILLPLASEVWLVTASSTNTKVKPSWASAKARTRADPDTTSEKSAETCPYIF